MLVLCFVLTHCSACILVEFIGLGLWSLLLGPLSPVWASLQSKVQNASLGCDSLMESPLPSTSSPEAGVEAMNLEGEA